MKIKNIINQIFRINSKNYPHPSIPMIYWDWKWNSKGNVEYNNFKTLINYIKK